MDDQKRQKVLLGLLAVAALGAGGWFFVLRDTGPDPTTRALNETKGRKKRAVAADAPARKSRGKRARATPAKTRTTAGRTKRARGEKKAGEGRAKRGQSKRAAKKRKKKTAPAACLPFDSDYRLAGKSFRGESSSNDPGILLQGLRIDQRIAVGDRLAVDHLLDSQFDFFSADRVGHG